MKYTEVKDLYQTKLTELHNKVGLFWAFNRDQLKEGMEKNPATKYTSIGYGGYLPSVNVEEYIAGMKVLSKWFKDEKKKVKKVEAILYELNNYECFYSGEIDDAYDALKDTYTREEVQAVYKQFRAQYANR